MGSDQNLSKKSVNVISRFTICMNSEVRERLFSLSFVILSEKLVIFCVISRDIAKITGFGCKPDFNI